MKTSLKRCLLSLVALGGLVALPGVVRAEIEDYVLDFGPEGLETPNSLETLRKIQGSDGKVPLGRGSQRTPTRPQHCNVEVSRGDLWLVLRRDEGPYRLRLGAGGSIWDGLGPRGEPLFSLPDKGLNVTDRVAQLVVWDTDVSVKNSPKTADYDRIWNFNQAGTAENRIAPVQRVRVVFDKRTCAIEIFSQLVDPWFQAYDSLLRARIGLWTRYEAHSDGVLKVTKVLLPWTLSVSGVTGVEKQGEQDRFQNLLLVHWTPLRYPTFRNLSTRITPRGNPTAARSHQALSERGIVLTDFPGYATVFGSAQGGLSVGMVTGNQEPKCVGMRCTRQSESFFKAMAWDTGLGMNPSARFGSLPLRSVVEARFALVFSSGVHAAMFKRMQALKSEMGWTAYAERAKLPPLLDPVVQKMKGLIGKPGARTPHLARIP